MTPAPRPGSDSPESLAESRRALVVESAERLVAVRGFDALRLRDVAQDAGVSIGLIQHYFDTRDDLLLHTMREASRRRVTEWTTLAEQGPGGRARLVDLLVGAISDPHRCAVWLETCAAASRHPALNETVVETQEAWRSVLRGAIDDGLAAHQFAPAVETDDAVEVLVALIDGIMLATAAEGDGPSRRVDRSRILLETADRLLPPVEPPESR